MPPPGQPRLFLLSVPVGLPGLPVGLLHPANIFPRPVSTQDLQRSYHALYLLFIRIQYHHLRDYPVLLRDNAIRHTGSGFFSAFAGQVW